MDNNYKVFDPMILDKINDSIEDDIRVAKISEKEGIKMYQEIVDDVLPLLEDAKRDVRVFQKDASKTLERLNEVLAIKTQMGVDNLYAYEIYEQNRHEITNPDIGEVLGSCRGYAGGGMALYLKVYRCE